MPRLLLIVDDDELSREVLALVADEAGFRTLLFDSGEAALAHLALHPAEPPGAMLIDMQMPGLAGDALALRLRPACGAEAVLVAMSGSPVASEKRRHFDAFLLKPFNFAAFERAFENAPAQPDLPTPALEILSQATYLSLAQSMPRAQLHQLYDMLLADADRRLSLMRQALTDGDAETYTRAAHAIKGGCGMVGALELASIASAMEEDGPPPGAFFVTDSDPFVQFAAASARLRSMLDAQP